MTYAGEQPRHDGSGAGCRRAGSENRAEVSLGRLLELATLTPAQAAQIAITVLSSLTGQAGTYGAVDAEDVLIDGGGRVRLAERDGEFSGAAVGAAGELIDQLARNVDRPVAHRRPNNAALLAALARCAAQLAAGELQAPLAGLRRELGATDADGEQLSRELAALVAVPLVRVGRRPQRRAG